MSSRCRGDGRWGAGLRGSLLTHAHLLHMLSEHRLTSQARSWAQCQPRSPAPWRLCLGRRQALSKAPTCCPVHSAGRPAFCFSVQSPSHADTFVTYNKNKCLRKDHGQGIAANAQMLTFGFCASLVLICNKLPGSGVHLNPTLRNAHSKGSTAQVRGEQSRAARGRNEGASVGGCRGASWRRQHFRDPKDGEGWADNT